MYAGRYNAAAEAADKMNRNVHPFYAAGVEIHAVVANTVAKVVPLHHQERRPLTDEEFTALDRDALTEDAVTALLNSTDGLDPRLWNELAGRSATAEEFFARSIVEADVCKEAPHLWLIALYGGLESSQPRSLLRAVCETAIRWAGGAVELLSTLTAIRHKGDDLHYSAVGDLISEMASIERKRPKVLRVVSNDSPDYTEIPLGWPGERLEPIANSWFR